MAKRVDPDWLEESAALVKLEDNIWVTKTPLPLLSTYSKRGENYDIGHLMDLTVDAGMQKPAMVIITSNPYSKKSDNWPLPSYKLRHHPITKGDIKTPGFPGKVKAARSTLEFLREKVQRGSCDGIVFVCARAQGAFTKLIMSLILEDADRVAEALPVELLPEYHRVLARLL